MLSPLTAYLNLFQVINPVEEKFLIVQVQEVIYNVVNVYMHALVCMFSGHIDQAIYTEIQVEWTTRYALKRYSVEHFRNK